MKALVAWLAAVLAVVGLVAWMFRWEVVIVHDNERAWVITLDRWTGRMAATVPQAILMGSMLEHRPEGKGDEKPRPNNPLWDK